MGGLSIWHWLIVLLVVVLIFGTKKLKNLGTDLGGAVKGFKEGMKDVHASEAGDVAQPAPAPAQQVAQGSVAASQTVDVEAKVRQ